MHSSSTPARAGETGAPDAANARATHVQGYSGLELVHDVVLHLWDAVALICLGEGESLRYTELHRKMVSFAGRHLGESELTRTRHRLIRKALIEVGGGPNRSQVYTITAAGRKRLEQIHRILTLARSFDGTSSNEERVRK